MRIIGLILALCLHAQAYRGAVALIPGTFNSVTLGHYFSQTIIETLESQDFAVKVVSGLSGTGEFEPNGMIALNAVREWYQKEFPNADVPLTLIGHSAGGFCALYAATIGRDLPVKNIVLMSTPLEGSKLAERIFPDVLKYVDGGILDLRGLEQIKPQNVQKFLQNIRIPSNINVYAVGSSQNLPGFFDNRLNSKYLSVALSITGKIISEESDGIIERSSAYGYNTMVLAESGDVLNIQRLEHLHGNLEHPEQVLDSKVFLMGATMNIRFIDEEQKRMFKGIGQVISEAR
jgi:hypothetical protein